MDILLKKKVNGPACVHCEKELSDWSGNVMVSSNEMLKVGEISRLEVWCKQCTTKLDKTGYGRDYHNLWELSWVKETYFNQLESLVERMVESPTYHFSFQAVMDCVQLGRILYDNQIKVEDPEEE